MNEIKITSPVGSGTSFLRTIIEDNIECESVMGTHQYEGHSTENQVFILRNPKDTIASSAERHLKASKDKFVTDHVEIEDTDSFNNIIQHLINKYKTFILNVEDKENIFLITFEFLTTQTNKCVFEIAKRFNLTLKPAPAIDGSYDYDMSQLAILSLLGAGMQNRVPRGPKSEEREIIDSLVEANPMMEELNVLYLELLNKLQSTENML
jgi:hypothetical protein